MKNWRTGGLGEWMTGVMGDWRTGSPWYCGTG